MKSDIGLIGLGVMGQNLALNMARNGHRVSVYNRTLKVTEQFMSGVARNAPNIIGTSSIEELADSLADPKCIMLMVKAGAPVDMVIQQLKPYLSSGDIVIDGGNSYFKDSIRRANELEAEGLRFLGVGISGGEEGALNGPSIMPGGSKEAWMCVEKIFTDIAAVAGSGEPCCSYLGSDGAGHFVKMVHNGIEYADMQLIAETYFLMKELLSMEAEDIHKVFAGWNDGELGSYLIEITADILSKRDARTGKAMVDMILDCAGHKGTGKWTAQEALELGVPAPSLAEAVFARYISSMKHERVTASSELTGPSCVLGKAGFPGEKTADKMPTDMIKDLRSALYAAKICVYAQGFALLKQASIEHDWDLDFGHIALMWRGGCIIRAEFLDRINDAYARDPKLSNLMVDPYFKDVIVNAQDGWRRVVCTAVSHGAPVPALSSSLSYYDSYRSSVLPANLVQAQRDYFGAHTYERTDLPGVFHAQWLSGGAVVSSSPVER